MVNIRKSNWLTNPKVRVIITWVWWLPSAIITLFIILLLLGEDFSVIQAYPYLTTYVEIVTTWLIPLLFVILAKDQLQDYGFKKENIFPSIALATVFIAGKLLFNLLAFGELLGFGTPEFTISFPWNIWYFVLGLFAYGPLEMFFVLFLIHNSDRIFDQKELLVSIGLILTVVLFGIAHIITTRDLGNAAIITITFFLLGLIYKYTDNSIGPILAWTIINNYNWFILQWIL